jgi:hypothetical protein
LISSAKRLIISVFAANSPVLSVMAEPPILSMIGLETLIVIVT